MHLHGVRKSFVVAAGAVVALLGCSRISTVAEAIYIPGDSAAAEKLALAERIGNAVWQEGLTKRVKDAYPKLDDEQLAGVFIRWETISVTPVTGQGEASTGVRIRTGIQFRGNLEEARDIATLCGDLVEVAVSDHFGGRHEIHRLHLSERALGF